jgi:hypothetical protein
MLRDSRTYLIIAAAFTIGTLVGFAVHPSSASAQDTKYRGDVIYVREIGDGFHQQLHGTLRGFSCVADSSGSPHCFAASD